MNRTEAMRELLCEQWCSGALIADDAEGLRISLPVHEADGDAVTLWIKPAMGGWHISDMGTTFMRLSYDMEFDLLSSGQRAQVLSTILEAHGIEDSDGELTMVAPEGELGPALLSFGVAISRVGDLRFWSRGRVHSTFYDDLGQELRRIAGAANVHERYEVPGLSDAADYAVDFYVSGGSTPLYVFGVPNADKAKLATIVLQRLQQADLRFESLVVPSEFNAVPPRDLRRLMNAANDMVDGFEAKEALERKVRHRIAM